MKSTWTVKDLKRAYDWVDHCKVGYCCYQDAGVSKYDLIELGYNSGVYGWNWTAYLDPKTSTLYKLLPQRTGIYQRKIIGGVT